MAKNNLKSISKKVLITSLSVATAFSISSCKKDQNTAYIKDAIAIVYDNNKPFLINKNKETYPLDYYDEVINIFNEYIAVKKDGKYGFINRTGKLVIEAIYDRVYPMYEEKAVVIKDGKYFIIDNTGKTVYEFKDNIISESYFNENHLIVKKDDLYGYLIYDKTSNSYNYTDIIYNQVSIFKNNYGVVGKFEEEIIYKTNEDGTLTDEIDKVIIKENLKYNFLKEDNTLLFNEFTYDFADTFYDGYARVGNMGDIYSPVVGGDMGMHDHVMKYKYIDTNGKPLNLDYYYTYTYINSQGLLESIEKHDTDVVEYPYASNFSNGYCIVAKYRYHKNLKRYLKEYLVIDTDGDMKFVEAIYSDTGYRYGFDTDPNYQNTSPSMYWMSDLCKIGNHLTFRVGNTLNGSSFQVKTVNKDIYNDNYVFNPVDITIFEKTNEQNETYKDVPTWAREYNMNYLNGTSSTFILEQAISRPYEMSNLSFSKYYSDEIAINTIRILRSDDYGMMQYEVVPYFNSDTSSMDTKLVESILLDPIYDKIVY